MIQNKISFIETGDRESVVSGIPFMDHIVCIASEHKGDDFLEEAHNSGWRVTLVTRKKLLDAPWAWHAISDVTSVEDDAQPIART